MRLGFSCPKCKCVENSVVDSRPRIGTIKRRRKCLTCGHKVTTIEVPVSIIGDADTKFAIGSMVQAKGNIEHWRGRVVGTYVAAKRRWYCVESHFEPGCVRAFRGTKLTAWDTPTPKMGRLTWTPEMTAALIEARKEGATYLDCEAIIGVGVGAVAAKCRDLKIGGKMNRGRTPGREVAHD